MHFPIDQESIDLFICDLIGDGRKFFPLVVFAFYENIKIQILFPRTIQQFVPCFGGYDYRRLFTENFDGSGLLRIYFHVIPGAGFPDNKI